MKKNGNKLFQKNNNDFYFISSVNLVTCHHDMIEKCCLPFQTLMPTSERYLSILHRISKLLYDDDDDVMIKN